jgi:uncharacterized membrane protein required for colicin V production
MSTIDIIIIFLLIIGAFLGYRKGALRSIISLIGLITVFVLSYSLKNILTKYFYTNFPFFDFKGYIKGASVLNIFFYEILAFVLTAIILLALLSVIGKLSGLLQKILDGTVILGLFSRLVGAVVGTLEIYMIIFTCLYILNFPVFTSNILENSYFSNKILYKTPLINNILSKSNTAIEEVKSLKTMYKETKDVDKFNYESLNILLKYEIITKDSVEILVDNNKLHIKDIDKLLENYESEVNND